MNTIQGIIHDLGNEETVIGGCTTPGEVIITLQGLVEENNLLKSKLKKIEQAKEGHWIYFKAVNTSEIIWSECSECKDGISGCATRMNYCPICGAKMKKA